jgi:hypothetical protein
VVKTPPPPKPVVPAVAYDNTPKTEPWWTLADGVTARQKESKPAWWSTPQGSGAEAAPKPKLAPKPVWPPKAKLVPLAPNAKPPPVVVKARAKESKQVSPTKPTDGVEQSDGSFLYKF